jgi:2-keto-3-deoxy-L-rhamnonate aldolase RhmA
MHRNLVKDKLEQGQPTYGYGIRFFAGPEQAQFAANAGFDFLFIDAEHGCFDLKEGAALCRAALHTGVTPLVRVCGFDHHLCTQYLDNGAQGIIFPHVESVEQVELIGRELFFPPRGDRSLPGPMAINDFRPIPHTELIDLGNETTLAVAMLETPEAIKRLDDLLAPGILDVVLIGANDLSTTLGVPAQWDSDVFTGALESTVSACEKAGVPCGIGGLFDAEILAHWTRRGMTFHYCMSDGHGLIQYPVSRLQEIKQVVDR